MVIGTIKLKIFAPGTFIKEKRMVVKSLCRDKQN